MVRVRFRKVATCQHRFLFGSSEDKDAEAEISQSVWFLTGHGVRCCSGGLLAISRSRSCHDLEVETVLFVLSGEVL